MDSIRKNDKHKKKQKMTFHNLINTKSTIILCTNNDKIKWTIEPHKMKLVNNELNIVSIFGCLNNYGNMRFVMSNNNNIEIFINSDALFFVEINEFIRFSYRAKIIPCNIITNDKKYIDLDRNNEKN